MTKIIFFFLVVGCGQSIVHNIRNEYALNSRQRVDYSPQEGEWLPPHYNERQVLNSSALDQIYCEQQFLCTPPSTFSPLKNFSRFEASFKFVQYA